MAAAASATCGVAGGGYSFVSSPAISFPPAVLDSNSSNKASNNDNDDRNKDSPTVISVSKNIFEAFEQNVATATSLRESKRGEGARTRDPSQISLRSNKSFYSDTVDVDSIVSCGSYMDTEMDLENDRIISRKRPASDQVKGSTSVTKSSSKNPSKRYIKSVPPEKDNKVVLPERAAPHLQQANQQYTQGNVSQSIHVDKDVLKKVDNGNGNAIPKSSIKYKYTASDSAPFVVYMYAETQDSSKLNHPLHISKLITGITRNSNSILEIKKIG